MDTTTYVAWSVIDWEHGRTLSGPHVHLEQAEREAKRLISDGQTPVAIQLVHLWR